MQDLSQLAITAALSSDWDKAASFNEEILGQDDKDIDALSRLAYAYTQLGKIDKAKKLYHTILSLDRYNFIAQKNLDRIKSLPKRKIISKVKSTTKLSPNLFIEEPGKTKTITLKNLAPVTVMSKMRIGDMVKLFPKKHSIEVRDSNKTYLGALPDDVSFRLLRFLKAGNLYHVCVKNIQKNILSVYIRELKRGKRFINQPTFLTTSHDYTTSTLRLPKKVTKSHDEQSILQDELDE